MKPYLEMFAKAAFGYAKQVAVWLLLFAFVFMTATGASAAAADPTTLITEVSTAFDSTTVVVVAMMGFSLIALVVWKFLKKGK